MNIYLYFSITLIVLYSVLASTILRKHLGSAHHRRFSFFLISVVLWLTAFYCLHIMTDADGMGFWAGLLVLLSSLSAAVLLHFAVRWVDANRTAASAKSLLIAGAYIGTALFIAPATGGDIVGVNSDASGSLTLVTGFWTPVWLVFNSSVMFLAAVLMLKTRSGREGGTSFGNTGLALFSGVIAIMSAGVLDIFFISDQSPFVLSLTAYLIFFGFMFVAVLKYGFLRVSVNLRETAGYFVSSLLVALPFLLIFFVLSAFTAESQFSSRLYFGLLFIVGIAVANAWQPLQMMTDRWLNRERYDSYKAIELLNLKTVGAGNPEELLKAMADVASEVTGVQTATIRMVVHRDDPVTELYRQRLQPASLIEANDQLVKQLIDSERGSGLLDQQLGSDPYTSGFPIRTANRIEGVLLLGRRLSGKTFSGTDRQTIDLLTGEMASKLENFRLELELLQKTAIAEAAKEAERFKSELLSEVSHELRTPLSSIKGFASSLLAADVVWSPAQQRDFIEEIVSESNRLDRLISDLLDMSRLENGQFRLNKELVDIPLFIGQLRPRLERLAGSNRLNVDLGGSLPGIHIDRIRIEQVITNLVDNAAKYAPGDSPITLSARSGEDELIFGVSDEGPGIPAEDIARIFQRFYRGRPEVSSAAGLGLGLAICRGIVTAHGGRIWVENNPGTGATFSFTLPIEKDA